MSEHELLLYLQLYRILIISPRELWNNPHITPQIARAFRRHHRGIARRIARSETSVCPSRDLHRRYWRKSICKACEWLLQEVS